MESEHIDSMIEELDVFITQAKDEMLKEVFTSIRNGLQSYHDDPQQFSNPYLVACKLDNPEYRYGVNQKGVQPLDVNVIEGNLAAKWKCNSFYHRLKFLMTGEILELQRVRQWGASRLRMDVETINLPVSQRDPKRKPKIYT